MSKNETDMDWGLAEGQPARTVPTRPGHWMIEADPLHSPDEIPHEVVRIRQGSGGLLIVGKSPARVDQRPDIVWLAEIPGPAVLVALAEYGEALVGLGPGPDLEGPPSVMRQYDNAEIALQDAIRAERDGVA